MEKMENTKSKQNKMIYYEIVYILQDVGVTVWIRDYTEICRCDMKL